MAFLFGIVNTAANAVIIFITVLNIVVYKLRQLHESNQQLPESKPNSSSQQHQNDNLGRNSSFPSSSSKSTQLCRHFSLSEILIATSNFDNTLVIGQGGFGKVYKGIIDNGSVTVAIKRLNPKSKQGAPQFWTEVELLSKFRHSHLVSLIGYCNNQNEMILVYEHMPRGSLADHLYKAPQTDTDNNNLTLSWVQRLKICIGAAQGLDYLHTGTGIHDRVIHRDMKSSNILLDDSFAAKVSDFGLSKIGPANQNSTHVSTNVKGTFGYLDPEYFLTRRLTRKSDVYSFGVVLLEVLSGKRASDLQLCEEYVGLTGWAKESIKKGELDQIVDPHLKWEILQNSLKAYVQIVEQCLHYRSKKRPTMAEVVASLESVLALQERRDSSMFEEDFLNQGWTSDNQENQDDSPESPGQVNNAGNVGDQGKEIDHIVLLSDTNNLQPKVKPGKITPFERIVKFFLGKSRVDSVYETSNTVSSRYDFDTYKVETEKFAYDFDSVKAATKNFSFVIGKGASGYVYKGRLQDGRAIAVKKIDYSRAEPEFRNEMFLMGKLQHRNLVDFLGFCSKRRDRLLIYEYLPNSSLDYFLHDPTNRLQLDWGERRKIIRGVARGLLYLHEDSPVRIVHLDLKPRHILLDAEMNPKIYYFGLSCLLEGGESEVSVSAVRGTLGYIAPEFFSTGRISVKLDVFSFGISVLEIVSGREAHPVTYQGETLDAYAFKNCQGDMFPNLVDRQLNFSQLTVNEQEEVKRCINVALLCVQENPADRPTMSTVVHMLNNSSCILREPSLF